MRNENTREPETRLENAGQTQVSRRRRRRLLAVLAALVGLLALALLLRSAAGGPGLLARGPEPEAAPAPAAEEPAAPQEPVEEPSAEGAAPVKEPSGGQGAPATPAPKAQEAQPRPALKAQEAQPRTARPPEERRAAEVVKRDWGFLAWRTESMKNLAINWNTKLTSSYLNKFAEWVGVEVPTQLTHDDYQRADGGYYVTKNTPYTVQLKPSGTRYPVESPADAVAIQMGILYYPYDRYVKKQFKETEEYAKLGQARPALRVEVAPSADGPWTYLATWHFTRTSETGYNLAPGDTRMWLPPALRSKDGVWLRLTPQGFGIMENRYNVDHCWLFIGKRIGNIKFDDEV